MKTVIIAIAILIVVVGGAWLYLRSEGPAYTGDAAGTAPELTEETAAVLLEGYLFADCRPEGIAESYRSCTLDVEKENGRWIVTVVYDGFFDDSVQASRMRAQVTYENGAWRVGDIEEMQKCWPGRGHQDFSVDLCI